MKLVDSKSARKFEKTQKWMSSVTEDLNLVFSSEVVSECCFPNVNSYFSSQYDNDATRARNDLMDASYYATKLKVTESACVFSDADDQTALLYQELTQNKKKISNPILESLQFYIAQSDENNNKGEWGEVFEATTSDPPMDNSKEEEASKTIDHHSDMEEESETASEDQIMEFLIDDDSEEEEDAETLEERAGKDSALLMPFSWRTSKGQLLNSRLPDANSSHNTAESNSSTSMNNYAHDVFWSPRIIRDIAEEWALAKSIGILSKSMALEELTMMLVWEKNLPSVLLTGVYVAPKYLSKKVTSIGSLHSVMKWIDKVMDLLCYPDETIQIGAALTLLAWSEPAPEALHVLSEALKSLDLNSRWCAARCLTYLGTEMTSHLKPIISTMFSVLDSNLGPITKSRALNLLAKLSTASAMVEILATEKLKSLDNRDIIIACQVLKVLLVPLSKPLIEQLVTLMWAHFNANIRQAAFAVLRRPECHPQVLCFLYDILKSSETKKRSNKDKVKAMRYLIHSGDTTTQLLSASVECFRNEEEEVRLCACEVVSHFKLKTDKAILELTRMTYCDPSPAVQLRAIQALHTLRVADIDVKDSLCWCVENGLNEEIRKEAQQCLIDLGLVAPPFPLQPSGDEQETEVEMKDKEILNKDSGRGVEETIFRQEVSPFLLPPESHCKSDSQVKRIESILRQHLHEYKRVSKSDSQLNHAQNLYLPELLPFSAFEENQAVTPPKGKLKRHKSLFRREFLPVLPIQIEHSNEDGISVYY